LVVGPINSALPAVRGNLTEVGISLHGGEVSMRKALITLVALALFLGDASLVLYAADSKKPPTEGKVSKDLGLRSLGFGSQGQSQELLKLMRATPNKTGYEITYRTDVDAVTFECDLSRNVLTRIHRYKDGRGKQEIWSGYVAERLKSASTGGSLNDTPDGKKPGTFQSF
jgi:hypothetical protein